MANSGLGPFKAKCVLANTGGMTRETKVWLGPDSWSTPLRKLALQICKRGLKQLNAINATLMTKEFGVEEEALLLRLLSNSAATTTGRHQQSWQPLGGVFATSSSSTSESTSSSAGGERTYGAGTGGSGNWRGGNGSNWSNSGSTYGFAAGVLGALAWGVVGRGPVTVFADANPKMTVEESAAAAKVRLMEVWHQVEHELDRQKAHLPANCKMLTPPPPQVQTNGSNVSVSLPIQHAADFNAVMSSLLEMLQQEEGSISIKSHQYGTSHTVSLERTPLQCPRGASDTSLKAQVFMPSRRDAVAGELTLHKSGALTEKEIEGLAAVLQQGNTIVAGSGAPNPFTNFDPWMGSVRQGWEQGREAFVEFGHDVEGLMDFMQQAEGIFKRFLHEFEGPKMRDDGSPHSVEFPPPFSTPDSPSLSSQVPDADMLPHSSVQRPLSKQWQRHGAGDEMSESDVQDAKKQKAINKLQSMGAKVFLPESKDKMDWGILAGYETQKREIEDCLLLPLQHPQVYDKVAAATRATPGSNRPRAVLFEGPPGTGKTTSARVMSSQAALPLVYLPLEAVVSKWYGESEQQLSAVFKACEALGGCILFLDELDALATSREGDIHEASRRLLSVLLREMDGFDTARRAVVIGATNRKQDLDAALLSRFDMLVNFGLPDEKCRQLILKQYAKQLSEQEVAELAARTPHLSGRDLRDVCEQTERRWASKIIRGEMAEDKLPTLAEYLQSAAERLHAGQHHLVMPYGMEPPQSPQVM